MRRPKKVAVKKIPGWTRTFWPVLFWHACGSCDDEIRNEYMWYQQRLGPEYDTYWQCVSCHKRAAEVARYRQGAPPQDGSATRGWRGPDVDQRKFR